MARVEFVSQTAEDNNDAQSYSIVSRYQVSKSGIITDVSVKSTAGGSVKFAVYDDASGPVPYNRLTQQTTGQSVVSGWNVLSLPDRITVANNDWLWVEVDNNAAGANRRGITSGTKKLWKSEAYSSWATDNPFVTTGYGVDTSSLVTLKLLGYELPTITDSSYASICHGLTGVAITGTSFVDADGNPTFYLGNESTWAACTVTQAQSASGVSDTGATLTINKGLLSNGIVYLYAVTAMGQVNATGYSLTLADAPSISGVSPSTVYGGLAYSVSGADFGADCTFFLGNASTWAACTSTEEQTVTSTDDESAALIGVRNSLTNGTVYLYAITAGDFISSGYSLTLADGPNNIVEKFVDDISLTGSQTSIYTDEFSAVPGDKILCIGWRGYWDSSSEAYTSGTIYKNGVSQGSPTAKISKYGVASTTYNDNPGYIEFSVRVGVYTVAEAGTYKVQITKTADSTPGGPVSWAGMSVRCISNTSDIEHTGSDGGDVPTASMEVSAQLNRPGYRMIGAVGAYEATTGITYLDCGDLENVIGEIDAAGEDSISESYGSSPSKVAVAVGYWIETGDASASTRGPWWLTGLGGI